MFMDFFKSKKKPEDNSKFSPLKVVFILKRREDYSSKMVNGNYSSVATGMWNSSKFVSDMLNSMGIKSYQVMVIDNNDIDKVCADYKPTHVFIEGLWVVPDKFDILKKLHPNIVWTVRCHSETPFLAQEGIAMNWIAEYWKRNVYVAANSPRMQHELKIYCEGIIGAPACILFDTAHYYPLLTNYYPIVKEWDEPGRWDNNESNRIDIGCFGAIRLLKNQLIQASAAYEYAQSIGKKLYFHINSGRVEGNADPVLKNIRSYFDQLPDAELVEHSWSGHKEFLSNLSYMNLLLQCSFSETYNIVTADALSCGVPVVVSSEIPYAKSGIADPTCSEDIVQKIRSVMGNSRYSVAQNVDGLNQYSLMTKKIWKKYFENELAFMGL